MSIKVRLTWMLVLGLVVPILILILLNPLVGPGNEGPIANIERSQDHYLNDPEVKKRVDTVVESLVLNLKENPDQIYNEDFMNQLNDQLQPINAQIVATSLDDQLIYAGADFKVPPQEIDKDLQSMGPGSVKIVDWDFRFLIHKIIHLKTSTNEPINIMILTQLGQLTKMRSFIVRNLLMIITVFMVVYIVLVYHVNRSINTPLDRLKEANERLSKGDFSYRIGEYTNDKIGEVSKSFDFMMEQAEQAIAVKRKYDQDRKELIASISHDLKTPLTAIKVNAAAINDGIADTEVKKEKAFEIITRKIDYMQYLIEELFLYSKLDMEKETFNFQKVPLHRFMEDVIEEWQMEHDPQEVRVTLDYDSKPDFNMAMDVDKMKRVVVNILENSIKYAGVKPLLIHIGLKRENNRYILSLDDNGVGVAEEELSRLFERFYRIDVSRNSESTGSGLGLAISKRIVEAHNGRIYAKSGVNQGMHIYIEFNPENPEEV